MAIWFVFGFMCALLVLLAGAYFKFVALQKQVRISWLRLDHALKMRAELIPSIALSAASLPDVDRTLLRNLSDLKDGCRALPDVARRVPCENEITRSLRKVFEAARPNAELTTSEHFLRLQKNLLNAESKAQSAKRKYNSAVRDFNTLTGVIPLNLIALMFEFKPVAYFDLENSLDKIL